MNNKLPIPDFMREKAIDLFGDLFVLSCMWLLCSLPVVTIPLASIALYDAVAHSVVGGEKNPVKRFWFTVRQELIRGILMGIELLVIAAVVFMSHTYVQALGEQMPIFKIYSYVYLLTMVIPLGILVWIIPVQSRFCYKYWELHKAAGVFALSNLPQTAWLVGLLVGTVAVLVVFPVTAILLLILPGVLTLVQTGSVEPAFAPYMQQTKEEEND